MLIDGTIYMLPDGTSVRASLIHSSWILLDMLDGTPYAGVYPFGIRRLVSDVASDSYHAVPCDLTEDDLVTYDAESMR